MNVIKVPIASVLPWDKNPRGIKTKDFDRLKKQIKKLGVYKPLVCYREDGHYIVLGGNMRIRALKDMGLKEVDISVVTPKCEAEKIEFALSDNDRAGFYEEDKLAELVYPHIKDIDLGDFKVDLGEAIDLKQLVERFGPDIDDGADDVPEVDDTPAITKMGDLFTLGKHRLLCGDSTKAEDVARLMRGGKADTITDPPYGIGYEYSAHDDVSNEKNSALVDAVMALASGSKAYTPGLMNLARELDKHPSARVLVWHKGFAQAGNGLGGASTWEPVLCLDVKKATLPDDHLHFGTDREPGLREGHPCPKPVKLFAHLIQHLTTGNIYDPFLGSGTTLIAAEKTGRICYGMEIDPKYCDVIIKRYADYVGADEKAIRKTVEHGKA